MMRLRSETVAGIPLDGDSTKVRRRDTDPHRYELSPEVSSAFDRIWTETIGAEFGHGSYADLVAELVP